MEPHEKISKLIKELLDTDPYIRSRLLTKELDKKEICLILRRMIYLIDKDSLYE